MIKPIILSYERMKAVAAMPNGKVFIRGAGINGHLLFADLADLGIRTFAFIDAGNIQPPIVNGCQVLKPEEFYTLYPSTQSEIFVACSISDRNVYRMVRIEMEEHGYREQVNFADFGVLPDMYRPSSPPIETVKPIGVNRKERLDKEIKGIYEYLRVNLPSYIFSIENRENNLVKIPSVGLFITSKCSLKCKLCGVNIPDLNNKKDFEPDIIISDTIKLFSVASIGMIYLIGGEPFCHTKFEKIIDLLLNMDLSHCDCIKIVTNSTIKPNEAIMGKIARLKNVHIFSSDYGKFSKKKDDIISSCKANGIPHISNDAYKWVSFGDMKCSRNYSIDTLKHLFKICNSAICFTLLDGKLYVCGQLAIYYYYNLIPDNPSDYIDIRNTTQEELQEKLYKFIYETEYFNGCQYCNGIYFGCKEYPKAEQVNSRIGG